jgi:hypothetical protein
MFRTKTILVLGLTAFFAQSGDMPPVPVAKQTEEFALKARREGQLGLQIPIPPDLFAKVTETISVYPTICDAPIAPVCPTALGIQRLGNVCLRWLDRAISI